MEPGKRIDTVSNLGITPRTKAVIAGTKDETLGVNSLNTKIKVEGVKASNKKSCCLHIGRHNKDKTSSVIETIGQKTIH